jgi:NADH-quinone oxidoreductase subunit J
MSAQDLAFYYLSFAMILSGLFTVFSRNPVHAVLSLLVLVVHQAFMLYLLGSEFLSAIQIIVYAGAVVVLFLFVVYLINLQKEARFRVFVRRFSLGLIFFILFAFLFVKYFVLIFSMSTGLRNLLPIDPTSSQALKMMARYLFTEYLFQFELIGVILLVVVFGTVFLLRKVKEERLG